MSQRPQARVDVAPSPGDVLAYLDRLLASPAFRASARRRKLLAYIVDRTLAGQSERLKAFDIALAILGRDERFDPQTDPIVRIEAGRLRRDLDQYYLADGRDDPIRISIPKGHYVPAFEFRADCAEPVVVATAAPGPGSEPRRWRPWRWVVSGGLVVTALIGAIVGWSQFESAREPQVTGPALMIVPFQGLGGGEDGQLLASGLTNGLIADLMRFDGLQVFATPSGGDDGTPLPHAAASAPAYVLSGGVQREPGRLRVTAKLAERISGRVLWSQQYDRALRAPELLEVQDDIAAGIASRLAQEYGVLSLAASTHLAHNLPQTMFAYECVQRAFAFRRTFAPEDYPPVRACLEEAVRRDPDYAAAWAMLAFAHMDAARFELVEPSARPAELDAGLAAAQRAVALAPETVRSLQALAALQFARGEHDEAERVQRRVIALNPHNPESLAQLGWRLMARGRWEEGGQLLQEAIDRSMVVPTWYHETLALALYLGGDDLGRARDQAELGKEDRGYATLAITEAALGHAAAAQAALHEALRRSPLLARDPVAFWANFQGSPEVITRLNAGLAKAGLRLPVPAAEPAPRS